MNCSPPAHDAEHHQDSDNLVAVLNLPNMRHAPDARVEVFARAVRGLLRLESKRERELKYLDFIDIHAALRRSTTMNVSAIGRTMPRRSRAR